MHTKVRWLSRGDSLQRLVDIFDSTVEFLGEVAPLLCYELKKCKKHLLYLVDIYSKFNEIQKRLQGRDVTIIQTCYNNSNTDNHYGFSGEALIVQKFSGSQRLQIFFEFETFLHELDGRR